MTQDVRGVIRTMLQCWYLAALPSDAGIRDAAGSPVQAALFLNRIAHDGAGGQSGKHALQILERDPDRLTRFQIAMTGIGRYDRAAEGRHALPRRIDQLHPFGDFEAVLWCRRRP